MAAATATAFAAENVRKEVAGLFAEAVATTIAIATTIVSAAKEKKATKLQLAAAKALLTDASIKEAALTEHSPVSRLSRFTRRRHWRWQGQKLRRQPLLLQLLNEVLGMHQRGVQFALQMRSMALLHSSNGGDANGMP